MNHLKGIFAENIVVRFLETQGHRVVARNYRRVGAELDIVAVHNRTLIFVEVKYCRNMRKFEELLRTRKRKALLKGARMFLSDVKFADEIRFSSTQRFDLAIVVEANPPELVYAEGVLDVDS